MAKGQHPLEEIVIDLVVFLNVIKVETTNILKVLPFRKTSEKRIVWGSVKYKKVERIVSKWY